jgi:hypothetical protein
MKLKSRTWFVSEGGVASPASIGTYNLARHQLFLFQPYTSFLTGWWRNFSYLRRRPCGGLFNRVLGGPGRGRTGEFHLPIMLVCVDATLATHNCCFSVSVGKGGKAFAWPCACEASPPKNKKERGAWKPVQVQPFHSEQFKDVLFLSPNKVVARPHLGGCLPGGTLLRGRAKQAPCL